MRRLAGHDPRLLLRLLSDDAAFALMNVVCAVRLATAVRNIELVTQVAAKAVHIR